MYTITEYDSPTDSIGKVIFNVATNRLVSAGKLTLKESDIDDFELSVNQNNPLFGRVKPLQTHIVVKQGNKILFKGRALKPKREMMSSGQFVQSFSFESILAYLLDSTQRFKEVHNTSPSDFFKLLIDVHNSQVPGYKQFKVGNVDVTNSTDNVYRFIDYANTYDTIKDKLISHLGGFLRVRIESDGNYIDYLKDPGKEHSTDNPIKVGRNLKSASVEIDPTNVITRFIPLGATIESDNPNGETNVANPRITIASVNGGKDYIDIPELQAVFGVINGTNIWDDVHTPETLKPKAEQWIRDQTAAEEHWTISAVEIGLDRFKTFNVSDSYQFINPAVAEPQLLRITQKVIDLLNPHSSSLTIGDKKKTLTQYQSDTLNAAKQVDVLKSRVAAQTAKIVTISNELGEIGSIKEAQSTQDELIKELQEQVQKLQEQTVGDQYYEGSIIDVSEFQGTINWSQVVSGGLALSIIRVQSGSSHIDGTYTANIPNAISAGANYAVYAYFSALNAADAEIEARDFYNRATSAIGSRKQPRFWMIDVERNSVTSGTLSAAVTAYMNKLNALGIPDSKIVIYVSNALYRSIDVSRTQIWIPSYGANDGTISNSKKPLYPYDLWQYTSVGRVSGISANVDMSTDPSDRFKKTYLTKG